MNVRFCSVATLLLTMVALLPGLATAAEQTKRPNLVIMIADDVAWNDIGCYGHPHIKTPHIDALAREGLRFDAAFLTCSSCSPSRSSIMTGRYPHSTGAGELHQSLPANQVVFAGLLKQAGYYTAAAGKWHLGKSAEINFDRIEGGGPSGCEKWVTVLAERPRDKPFFLWLAGFDAHRGYAKNAIPEPHTHDDIVVPPYLPDNDDTRGDLGLYYDEISRLDSYLGKVMTELEKQGVADNTLVLFMSDNGRPFPRCKTTVYDSGVKTPFVVRWPAGVKAGETSASLVSAVDIAPTFIELAGLKSSPTFQGKSFAPILKNPAAKTRDYIHAEHNWHDYQAHERSARNDRWLYIHNAFPHLTGSPPADAVRSPTYRAMMELEQAGKLPSDQRGCFIAPRPAEELYDVTADPHQLNNLATDPAHAATLKQLQAVLAEWVKATDDRVPERPTPDKFDRLTGKGIKQQK